MLLEQLHSASYLPRGKTAFELQGGFAKLTIPTHKMRTNRHGERIYEQLREHLRLVQTRQNSLRQVVENGVRSSINTVKAFNLTHSGIVRNGIESGPGNMEVDPVDGARVSNARIRLKVAHGDSAHGPRPRLRVLFVGPEFPFPGVRMVQMNRNHISFFGRNGRGSLRDAATCDQPGDRQLRADDRDRGIDGNMGRLVQGEILRHLRTMGACRLRWSRHECLRVAASLWPRVSGQASDRGPDSRCCSP